MNSIYPGNASIFFKAIYEVVTFDILPIDEIGNKIDEIWGKYDNSEKHMFKSIDNFKMMGDYETINPLKNMIGTAFAMIFIISIILIITLILRYILFPLEKMK